MILHGDGDVLSAFAGKSGFQGIAGGVGCSGAKIAVGLFIVAGEANGAEGGWMADLEANFLDEVVDILRTVETGAACNVAGDSQNVGMDASEEFHPHCVICRRVETLSPDIAKT
jgi:hypothetical protein